MTRIVAAALLLLSLVLWLQLSWSPPVQAGPEGTKWEYRVFSLDPAEYTNKADYKEILRREGARKVEAAFQEHVLAHLGKDGWELVCLERRSLGMVYFYLKRPAR